jgi:hypothetical protein
MQYIAYRPCHRTQKCATCLHMHVFMFRLQDKHYEHPVCSCGLHVAVGRTRIGAMNDADRNSKYVSVLREHVTSDSVCLCLSDGSLLGPLAACLGAKRVYCVDSNSLTRHVIQDYIEHHSLQDRMVVLSKIHDLEALMEPHDKVQC